MLWLYILKCSDDTLYIGVTNNIDRRLAEHQEGINPEAYTYRRKPVELVFAEGFANYRLAYDWERRLKKWSGPKKWALINEDWDSVKQFAECRNESHYRNKDG